MSQEALTLPQDLDLQTKEIIERSFLHTISEIGIHEIEYIKNKFEYKKAVLQNHKIEWVCTMVKYYEILYKDGFRIIVPVQYGVNILEWNPGGENSLDKMEGKTGSPQNAYCYRADPISCSSNEEDNPITFYAYEWVNPRFGKIIKEVSLYGTIDYQATQAAGNPKTNPMTSNAILLAAISKVQKRVSKNK